jgi:hypothetical protein
MMASDIVFSELLCFLHCKFGVVSNLALQNAINGCFEVDIICEAKKILYDVAEKCAVDLARMKVRQGDNKKRKECEDLVSVYEALDKAKCVLPRFVAEDLNKLPRIKVEDVDVCVFAAKLSELTEVVHLLQKQMSDMLTSQACAGNKGDDKLSLSSGQLVVDLTHVDGRVSSAAGKVGSGGMTSKAATTVYQKREDVTYKDAVIADRSKNSDVNYQDNAKKIGEVIKDWEDSGWHTVQHKKKIPPKFGTKDITEGKKNLKAAKVKRTWHVYVGNLDRGTTVNDVSDFLKENDIEVFMCDPLGQGRPGWDERPSAFHVEVDYAKKDTVMQESFWDLGVKVRNWTFPKKNKGW